MRQHFDSFSHMNQNSDERVTNFWINDPSHAGAWFHDKYLVATTSGTTGNIGVFLNDKASWGRTRAILFVRLMLPLMGGKGLLFFGPHRPFRAAFVVATINPLSDRIIRSKGAGTTARVAAKSEQIAVKTHFLSF